MTFNTRLTTVAFIIAVALIAGFALSVPRAREVSETGPGAEALAASTTPAVTLRDTYKKGVHTLTGSVTAPDACTSISVAATYASSTGPGILLALTMPPDAGMCLEVPTRITFSTAVPAPAGVPLEVRVNGMLATSTAP